jgi:hypothetical protein
VKSIRALRAEYLLPLACAAAAICVGASELMTMFELRNDGELLKVIHSYDRHYYALLILAVFAIVFLVIAVLTGSRPAAIAVAVAGGISLLIFLTVDVPKVNQKGDVADPTTEFFSTEAEPVAGFWFGLAGTVALALSGAGLATLRSDQLQAPLSARRRHDGAQESPGQEHRAQEPSQARTQGGRRSERSGDQGEQDAQPRTQPGDGS